MAKGKTLEVLPVPPKKLTVITELSRQIVEISEIIKAKKTEMELIEEKILKSLPDDLLRDDEKSKTFSLTDKLSITYETGEKATFNSDNYESERANIPAKYRPEKIKYALDNDKFLKIKELAKKGDEIAESACEIISDCITIKNSPAVKIKNKE